MPDITYEGLIQKVADSYMDADYNLDPEEARERAVEVLDAGGARSAWQAALDLAATLTMLARECEDYDIIEMEREGQAARWPSFFPQVASNG